MSEMICSRNRRSNRIKIACNGSMIIITVCNVIRSKILLLDYLQIASGYVVSLAVVDIFLCQSANSEYQF